MRMSIHRFNVKLKTTPPKTIHWRPLREVKYPALKINSITWEILVKKILNLSRKKLTNYD